MLDHTCRSEGKRVWTFNIVSSDVDAIEFARWLLKNQTNTEFYFDDETAVCSLEVDDVKAYEICFFEKFFQSIWCKYKMEDSLTIEESGHDGGDVILSFQRGTMFIDVWDYDDEYTESYIRILKDVIINHLGDCVVSFNGEATWHPIKKAVEMLENGESRYKL